MTLFCERCGLKLTPGSGKFYLINIAAIADPWPPNLSAEDLSRDFETEIRNTIAAAQGLSEQEAVDQVYRRLRFYLCLLCYRGWIEKPAGG
jgi:hypothetical protein